MRPCENAGTVPPAVTGAAAAPGPIASASALIVPLTPRRDFALAACHPAAQNEQWCVAAKSVVTCDCSGTSDSTLVPLNDGQGSARDDGLPLAAKLAQSVRMLAASACWPGSSTVGVLNRYGRSAPCVAKPRTIPRTGAWSSLN